MIQRLKRADPWALAFAAVALIAFLPFARGLLTGQCFYFRDLSRAFFPLRKFAIEGLLQGEVRYWNPYVHEGEPFPLSPPPVSYPVDLIQALVPNEWGFSLLLALHVPFAAVGLMALARGMGLSPIAAAGGALVYSLGGFALSCLNFYMFLQALAWAPLLILALLRAANGGRRQVAVGAILTAVTLSTMGAEVAGQAVICGVILAFSRRDSLRLLRALAAIALGFGLVAATTFVLKGLIAGSERGAGFSTAVVLGFSIHPVALGQVLVGGLFGPLGDLPGQFLGERFFPSFPYFLSLYLGATVLSIASVGAVFGPAPWRRVVALALLALLLGLGSWIKLDLLVEALPLLRRFRFPVKAFFTVHLAVALLTAVGLQVLRNEPRRAWRLLAVLGLGIGGLLGVAPLLPRAFPTATASAAAAFFPADYPLPQRLHALTQLLADAARGGLPAVAAGLLAALSIMGKLAQQRGVAALVALIGTDLLRTGSELNPTVDSAFYTLSPAMSQIAGELRARGGRLFTCEPEFSRTYHRAKNALRGGHDAWTTAVYMETLTPFHNLEHHVSTAQSRDITGFAPLDRALPPDKVGCASLPAIIEPLRQAGVSHLLSLAPVEQAQLQLAVVVSQTRLSPLPFYVYRLQDALTLREVATSVRRVRGRVEALSLATEPGFQQAGGAAVEDIPEETTGASGRIVGLVETSDRMDLDVEADRPTVVVVRDAYAPGWSASVNGSVVPVLRANGRHRAVAVGAGKSRVTLTYRPPLLRSGLALSGVSALITLLLYRRGHARARPVDTASQGSSTDHSAGAPAAGSNRAPGS